MFEIGTKVIPIAKTCLGSLEDSSVWRRARDRNQDYLYVVDINEYDNRRVYILNCNTSGGGDFFHPEDVVVYVLNKGR